LRSEVRSDSRLFRALSRALLDEGIAVRFRARGRSMFPAIADGDVVEISPEQHHGEGDVVMVDGDNGIRVHRVVSACDGYLITHGDSCMEPDAPVSSDAIVGRVSGVVADGKKRAPHTWRTRMRQIFGQIR
jgi:phage repressor protein C with HTH and peptisase S24 domain